MEVLRSGQPGMDAGLAAPGHGWPMAAGPRSRTGARHRTKGAGALGYLGLFQVTRRKGGTLSGRYRSNGYVHPQNTYRLTQSHREQARSHRDLQWPQVPSKTGHRRASLLAMAACQATHPVQIHRQRPVPQSHMVRLRDVPCVAHCLNASVGALHPPRCTRAPADGVNKGEQ